MAAAYLASPFANSDERYDAVHDDAWEAKNGLADYENPNVDTKIYGRDRKLSPSRVVDFLIKSMRDFSPWHQGAFGGNDRVELVPRLFRVDAMKALLDANRQAHVGEGVFVVNVSRRGRAEYVFVTCIMQ